MCYPDNDSFTASNSSAISFLADCEFANAYYGFKASLENFTILLAHQVHSTRPLCSGRANVLIEPVHIAAGRDAITSNTIAMYTRAFVIAPEAPWNEATLNWSDKPIVTAVLLYNMALSLHISGVQTGITVQLKEALKIYRMALSFLEEPARSRIVVRMAILNNISNICSMFYDLKCVDAALADMARLLECHNCLVTLDDDDQTLFSTNVLFFFEHPLVSAAPAA